MTLFLKKKYSGESLVDLEEDVWDSVDEMPKDEHGFAKGTFKVMIEWFQNE